VIEFDYHDGRRCHTVAMGPHSRQKIIQQSTNMLCGRSTSLKQEKNVFITSDITINRLPHVVTTHCIRRGYHRRHHGPVIVRIDDVLLVSGDVGVTTLRLLGASSVHRRWYGPKPPATMVSGKRDVSGETEAETRGAKVS
jgi:hypothetical protein